MVRPPDWKPKFSDPEIQAYIFEAAGEEGLEMFQYIQEHEPCSGEDIVEAYEDRKPSAVRKVLYAMMQAHILEYHKDTDSKGWETFVWATDLPEIQLIHQRQWEAEALELKVQLRVELDHEFYACAKQHERVIFEDAMDSEFQCPTCEEPMSPIDNSKEIAKIKARLDELQPALKN